MASAPKTLAAILSGRADANLRFAGLRRILLLFGFSERTTGGHHIFSRTGVEEIVNLQPLPGGKAKPYQVKQVRQLIIRHALTLPGKE